MFKIVKIIYIICEVKVEGNIFEIVNHLDTSVDISIRWYRIIIVTIREITFIN